ncbi:predicted protein [Naegleria gruberi]|uniref:Predicted protein n=1 Tax=Naegleria gruberi TaxID=5762 RepID=D2VWI1_NAEGR|nr:uncharacterized protein NAEGRDRAFT_73388 [Naegleria gruberi]EFC38897.1 predicted protein [Naegleria gruberi]|eukprot:XP_002671641.1 predicted protein [Naegleria gruberi strain NEG-M]
MYIFNILNYISEYCANNRKVTEISMCPTDQTRILVTTPQLALHHNIDVSNLNILAVDEMNLMLEFGSDCRKCIKSIFKQLPDKTRIICTGCEMPPPECYIHDNHLKNATIEQSRKELNELIIETFVYCPKPNQKLDLLKQSLFNISDFCIFFCNSHNRVAQSFNSLKEIYPTLQIAPQQYDVLKERFHSFTRSTIHLIGTEEDWLGIDVPWCNCIVHFDVVCDETKSRLRSGRCARFTRSGRVLYLPSTLEELDFVSGLILGSANCKYQRIMMSNVLYLDVEFLFC